MEMLMSACKLVKALSANLRSRAYQFDESWFDFSLDCSHKVIVEKILITYKTKLHHFHIRY